MEDKMKTEQHQNRISLNENTVHYLSIRLKRINSFLSDINFSSFPRIINFVSLTLILYKAQQ